MSEIDYLESVFDIWDDFSYDAEVVLDSGFDSWDLITDETTEVRSYSASLDDNKINFSVEYGKLEGDEGYALSFDPESNNGEYVNEVLSRLEEGLEGLTDFTKELEELENSEYFAQRIR